MNKKKTEQVTMENICRALDIALDARPSLSLNSFEYKTRIQVKKEKIVEFRRPTTWEKFMYGDADFAPWKRKEYYYEYVDKY